MTDREPYEPAVGTKVEEGGPFPTSGFLDVAGRRLREASVALSETAALEAVVASLQATLNALAEIHVDRAVGRHYFVTARVCEACGNVQLYRLRAEPRPFCVACNGSMFRRLGTVLLLREPPASHPIWESAEGV